MRMTPGIRAAHGELTLSERSLSEVLFSATISNLTRNLRRSPRTTPHQWRHSVVSLQAFQELRSVGHSSGDQRRARRNRESFHLVFVAESYEHAPGWRDFCAWSGCLFDGRYR